MVLFFFLCVCCTEGEGTRTFLSADEDDGSGEMVENRTAWEKRLVITIFCFYIRTFFIRTFPLRLKGLCHVILGWLGEIFSLLRF